MTMSLNEKNQYFNQWPLINEPYQARVQDYTTLYLPDEVLDHNQEDPHTLAMTGPKDVVIVIDVSYTEGEEHKIFHLKRAVIKAIKALTYADYAMIVWFHTSSLGSQGTELLPMTDTNKTTLIDYIKGFTYES